MIYIPHRNGPGTTVVTHCSNILIIFIFAIRLLFTVGAQRTFLWVYR